MPEIARKYQDIYHSNVTENQKLQLSLTLDLYNTAWRRSRIPPNISLGQKIIVSQKATRDSDINKKEIPKQPRIKKEQLDAQVQWLQEEVQKEQERTRFQAIP